ncbi:hypothetical protein P7K49_002170 [Saguinus oedipus]|uniref:Leucine-rich repeat-containing protein 26 n=1 Tax=Saguinus oedipus TaxID=9490 RepID=A0ABQ9WGM2_SAGOE|nr:hypothetical protein P7K49_002170 [Saguinus oedipus]
MGLTEAHTGFPRPDGPEESWGERWSGHPLLPGCAVSLHPKACVSSGPIHHGNGPFLRGATQHVHTGLTLLILSGAEAGEEQDLWAALRLGAGRSREVGGCRWAASCCSGLGWRLVVNQAGRGGPDSAVAGAGAVPRAVWSSGTGGQRCRALAVCPAPAPSVDPAVGQELPALAPENLLLDHNHLRALPPGAFARAGALQLLDLSENGLHSVHVRAFWGLGVLQLLDLSANQLEALAPGTFAPLRALRTLSLAGNRLARLEPAALGALPLLRSLSLQDNALAALAPGLLARLPALDSLHLHGNPWACSCALRPLCAWLRRHPLSTSGELSRMRVGVCGAGRLPRPDATSVCLCPAETEAALCVWPGRLTLSPLTAFPDAAFRHCAQPLALRDLAVVYALGPASFLVSVAACLALGSVLTACSARRRRRAAALRRLRRPRDPDSDPDPHCSPPKPEQPRPPGTLEASSPTPLPSLYSLSASTSYTDRNLRDIPLGITTAHTGRWGEEGQSAPRMGRTGKARARALGALVLYKVAGRARTRSEGGGGRVQGRVEDTRSDQGVGPLESRGGGGGGPRRREPERLWEALPAGKSGTAGQTGRGWAGGAQAAEERLRPRGRPAALPSRLSSAPSSAAPRGGRADGREAQGLPEQQDPSVSLAGLTGQVGASGGLTPRC